MKNVATFLTAILCLADARSLGQSTLPDPVAGPATSAGYYYENHGQIIDELGNPWPSILYYSEKGRERLFFAEDKIHHTLRIPGVEVAGAQSPDTMLRLDVRFDCMQESGTCGEIVTYEESQDFLNYFLPHCGSAGNHRRTWLEDGDVRERLPRH